MRSNQSNEHAEKNPAQASFLDADVPSESPLPDHLRAPAGTKQEIHEINLLLTAIAIGVHANRRWVSSDRFNAEASRSTAQRLCIQVDKLIDLMEKIKA